MYLDNIPVVTKVMKFEYCSNNSVLYMYNFDLIKKIHDVILFPFPQCWAIHIYRKSSDQFEST